MIAAAQERLLQEVFGSDSEDDNKHVVSPYPAARIQGLTHVKHWLSFGQQVLSPVNAVGSCICTDSGSLVLMQVFCSRILQMHFLRGRRGG